MTVLEPGSGMGYFTLPLAKMVGPHGKVVVVEVQAGMLTALERRAAKAGLLDRLDLRLCGDDGLGLKDLAGKVLDFAAAMYMVHEVPGQNRFFQELFQALKPGGTLLVIEPKGHVSAQQYEKTDAVILSAGFFMQKPVTSIGSRGALYAKMDSRA